EAWTAEKGSAARYLPAVSFGLLTLAQAACWFPVGKQVHALGVQPAATLLLTGALVGGDIADLARREAATLLPSPQRGEGRRNWRPRSGAMARERRKLSIVCPAFNEEEVLPHFHRALCAVLADMEAE